jgi:hypothetical protein
MRWPWRLSRYFVALAVTPLPLGVRAIFGARGDHGS